MQDPRHGRVERDAGKRRCGEQRWRDFAGILEREHCADGRRPSGLAPTHPRATMQKHEKKRVAGGASCNCLKTKGQICNHERGNLEVARESWREKEEEKGMKLRTGGGGRKCGKHKTYRRSFWKCGNDWSYGRFFGSVANTGLSDILEEGRDQEGGVRG